jgi:putative flippase GtrA
MQDIDPRNNPLYNKFNNSFIRFLVVGILNTFIGLILIYSLLHITSYWTATFIGNSIGAVVSFFLNRSFTFKSHSNLMKSSLKFFGVTLVCYFIAYKISFVAISYALGLLHIDNKRLIEYVAVLFGMGTYTILNYLGHRFYTFAKRGESRHE